ncbi:MAG: HK97 family phage prohead protease [Afipia sp.]
MERRLITTELRATTEDGRRKIGGYAAVFDTLSVVLWDFREEIAPGAFADAIEKNNVRALWNHDTSEVLGASGNGTLRLAEDSVGLRFELELPDTQRGRDAFTLIERGDVSQMSFGFRSLPDGDEWRIDEDGQYIRRLLRADLLEVSPVTFPAYPATSVGVRSEILGDEVQIPDAVRQAAQGVGVDSVAAEASRRARLAAMTETDIELAARRTIREGE